MIPLWLSNTQKKNNLWVHLASWNLPDCQLCLESKTEPSVAKGGTQHREKCILGGGDTAHQLGRGHRTALKEKAKIQDLHD